jgi:hypothetical protein
MAAIHQQPATFFPTLDTTATSAILKNMIRRQMGSDWLLITQHNHARLAGELAAHIGSHLFEKPIPNESFVQGVMLHDCGWPLHDDHPTLNPAGQPLDVFETPPAIALKVWSTSVQNALEVDARAGLLVSLHGLALSITATSSPAEKNRQFDLANPKSRFEINKFQHRQVEVQESLRKRLGLGTDLPLQQGLALESDLPAEQEIIFEFRLLQAMDALSLAICCPEPPVAQVRPVLARPGGRALSLRVSRSEKQVLHVSPWPFNADQIRVEVPFRRLPAKSFSSDEAGTEQFQKVYEQVPEERLAATLLPRR